MLCRKGVSREQAWDILNALRRQTAVELPFRDGEGRRGWYYPTRSIVANLDDIDKRCHAGSWLDLAVRSRNATYFLVEAHVDEAVATLKEDGLSIGYEKAARGAAFRARPGNLGRAPPFELASNRLAS